MVCFALGFTGFVAALVILLFYKLNDHVLQLMAMVNSGEMTRKAAVFCTPP